MKNVSIEKLENNERNVIYINDEVYKFMYHYYKKYYPNFEGWYKSKVVSGFKNNTRIIYVLKSDFNIYGVSVIKLSNKHKNKISSFFVLPEVCKNGLGTSLIGQALSVASNNGKPIIITVPEERLYEKISGQKFSRFLAKYGFSIYSAELGRYRPGKIEYVLYKS